VTGCLWRNEGLQPAITNVCCPKPRHHGGDLVFNWTLILPVRICQLVCVWSIANPHASWGVTPSTEIGVWRTVSLLHNWLHFFSIWPWHWCLPQHLLQMYASVGRPSSLGSKIFNGMEQWQNKKTAGDIDMGILSKEFS
jgi:hypothetical protein